MDDRKSYAKPLQVGEVMTAEAVARVLTWNYSAYEAPAFTSGWAGTM